MCEAENLIKSVEKYPCIWDLYCSDYHNRDIKELAWGKICEEIYEDWDSSSDKEKKCKRIQNKWKNVKDAFLRELRRRKSLNHSGTLPPNARKTTYMYYHKLQFMSSAKQREDSDCPSESESTNADTIDPVEPVVEIQISPASLQETDLHEVKQERLSSSNDDCSNISSDSGEADDTATDTSNLIKKPNLKNKLDNYEDESKDIVLALKETIDRKYNEILQFESDSDRLFLLSLLDGFKKIPPNARMKARIELMETIDRYQPENLNAGEPNFPLIWSYVPKHKMQRTDVDMPDATMDEVHTPGSDE